MDSSNVSSWEIYKLCTFAYLFSDVREGSDFFKRPIHLYVPHPNNAFSHPLFFLDVLESVNIYEDGLANYYDARSTFLNVGLLSRVIIKFFGFKISKMNGHLAGYDLRYINELYLSHGDLAVGKKR